MENKTIPDFFTPKVSSSVKRARIISPEQCSEFDKTMGDSKVGDLTHNELMTAISALLDKKLMSLATKEDVSGMAEDIKTLKAENVALREELNLMKNHERQILDKLNDLEGRSRRNNLVFRGLRYNKGDDYRKIVKDFCVNMMQCQDNIWVNRAHPIGKTGLLIAHFPDDADVNWIMSYTRKLRGTGYFVNRDYTKEVRKKRSYLMALRKELERVAGRRRMPLVFDHLVIEGCHFSWTGGKLMCGTEDGCAKLGELLKVDVSAFVRDLNVNAGPRRRDDGDVNEKM